MSTGRKALWQQKHPCCGQILFESVSKAVNKNTIEKKWYLRARSSPGKFYRSDKSSIDTWAPSMKLMAPWNRGNWNLWLYKSGITKLEDGSGACMALNPSIRKGLTREKQGCVSDGKHHLSGEIGKKCHWCCFGGSSVGPEVGLATEGRRNLDLPTQKAHVGTPYAVLLCKERSC